MAERFGEMMPQGAHPEPTSSLAPRPSGAPYRRHLPDERQSVTHKFRVGEQEGYVTVGLYDEGLPGEIFVNISKEGSTIRGLMDAVAMLTSVALQYGVPLQNLVDKFRGVHFEPAGLTGNPQIPVSSSLVDYIFRWLELRFLTPRQPASPADARRRGKTTRSRKTPTVPEQDRTASNLSTGDEARGGIADTPETSTGLACPDCGSILVFAEGCLVCRSCGYNKCG
jgi:ribonucleoside-diphosphate reductase alpha chain